ncbi:hypothetical protein DL95DRAFT_512168 [Leptodontidium sp. 2 PMI_412]|nr:hypothetical protein DL95DRAFT_512168 [Leptodontidium sp. 2 PMI_412]
MIMSNIYGKASSVIIWLGPGDHHGQLAFEWIEKTATGLRDHLSDPHEDDMTSDNQSHHTLLEHDFNPSRGETAALINTFGMQGDDHMNSIFGESTVEGRGWWHRKWVIQEVYHAKNVSLRCGYLQCDWELLEGLSLIMTEWADKLLDSSHTKGRSDIVWAKYAFGAVGPLSSLTRKSPSAIPTLSLEDAILESRSFESTEPRDHVYALLNICCFPIRTVTPDYTKPVHTVFADAAKVIISESLNLDILCRAQGKKSLMHDWADLGENILQPRGILSDVVTTVTPQIPMAPRESFMDEFLSWEESHLKLNTFPDCHSQNDATEEAYLRILLWDSIPVPERTSRCVRRRIKTEELTKYKHAWAQRWETRDTIVTKKLPPLADHSGMMPESRMRLQIMFEALREFS